MPLPLVCLAVAIAECHIVSTDSLSRRLGGLYCLYCLHEIQPFKLKFRIYISLQELGKLRDLLKEAKEMGVEVAAVVAKQMFERNMFIFGSVDLKEASAAEKINETTELQNRFMRVAYEKIFANSPIEKFLHLDMGKEVDLDAISKMSKEYAETKKHAIEVASKVGEVEGIKHISEEKELMGERLGKLREELDERRHSLYRRANINSLALAQTQGDQHSVQENVIKDDDGFDEIEQLLLQN
ncbi:PREDICTED: uncharacterized protein LOC104826552 isoform X2 [Tarenaya hassleriana]|uniref:uncharacterized protein LOC104826552 isoform X2 n=1 Tax=Tarenaya hassleriana TaxID=28532 RepID=UPI00053C0D87|nr:PREDICTED: uncharacterized protein LOC104826552 isoform X2 [Tarenaya hassleriana]